MQIETNHLGGQVSQDGMEYGTKKSNSLTDVCNSITKVVGGVEEGAANTQVKHFSKEKTIGTADIHSVF